MALLNRGDLEQTRTNLEAWMRSRLPEATDVAVSELSSPPASGFSNETFFFRATWNSSTGHEDRELVARLAPKGPQLFPTYDLDQQFLLMKTLADQTDVPMPPMLWAEPTSDNPMGEPFYVMGRVPGKVPTDDPPYMAQGWVVDLAPEARARMFDAGLDALARVHAVDWQAHGLDFLDRPHLGSTPLTQLIAYFEEYYRWARRDETPQPILDTAFAWVRENVPATEPPAVLCWGDSRPGNLIIADDQSVAAVIDWELACLGSRELDLGWWIFTQRMFSEGYGIPLPDGIPGAQETVARYEKVSGHQVKDIDFHTVFAGLRSALMMLRYCNVMIEAGAIPADSTMGQDNPIVQMLAKVMGMESKQGDVDALKLNRQQA